MGAFLICAGLLLEWCVGPVKWDAFAWPVNGIVAVAFVALVIVMHALRSRIYAFRFLGSSEAAVPAIAYAVALTIIMGLTRQDGGGAADLCLRLHDMLTFWPFVLVYVYLAVILGLVVTSRVMLLRRTISLRSLAGVFNHLGLLVVLVAGTLGNADMRRLKMVAVPHVAERRAVDAEARVQVLPFSVELQRFILERYDDGTPRRYASELKILTDDGQELAATVDVNHPLKVEGWRIYQYGFDPVAGNASERSILDLVRAPWLPLVYVGMYMMLAGALLLLVYTRWRYKGWARVGVLIAVGLCIVWHFMPVIGSSKLVPALQSRWFVPHIVAYIICYSLMGVAALMAIYALLSKKTRTSAEPVEGKLTIIDNLVYVGLMFMTFGMLFGAFWANEAWGHYWAWDPKETWAAITWLSFLIYIHYRHLPHHRPRIALLLIILSFVLLQMCWWGINYLPSAQGMSVHTYSS